MRLCANIGDVIIPCAFLFQVADHTVERDGATEFLARGIGLCAAIDREVRYGLVRGASVLGERLGFRRGVRDGQSVPAKVRSSVSYTSYQGVRVAVRVHR